MAWSLNNQSLYYSDGFSKSLVKCSYNLKRAEVSDCQELLDISQEYEKAVPRGMATDMNGNLKIYIIGVTSKFSETFRSYLACPGR